MALLQDKVALVTGAAAGIGEAVAELFCAEGAAVLALDRDGPGVQAVAARIRARGQQAQAATADVRDRAALAQAIGSAVAEHGRLDILINNAGIYPRKAFLEMTEAEWDEMQDINLKSLMHTCQLALPHMLRQGAGKIVNISSVTFFLGYERLTHYVAAKGGVIGMTRVLAREFGPHNIHVNCITPGAIKVEAEKRFVSEEQQQTILGNQSLKRRLMPLDLARVCLFLSCPLSDGMTGQTLNVDGGWVMY
jgi:3-oxoacyl-[acyl-carrier protein] reductase